MKINTSDVTRQITFKELKPGTIFKHTILNKYYVKLSQTNITNVTRDIKYHYASYNAYCFDDNLIVCCEENDSDIVIVDAELTIK